MKKIIIPFLLATILPLSVNANSKNSKNQISITKDGKFFQYSDGKPFFWMADTNWLMAQKLNREEIDSYFKNRKAKGFNVVQTVVFQMLNDKKHLWRYCGN